MSPNEQAIRGEVATAKVRLRPHRSSSLMGLYGRLASLFGVKGFQETFWLTLDPVIYHPNHIADPLADPSRYDTIRHELVHVKQQRGRLTAWVLKYLCSQRFRWEAEREAYLVNIRAGEDPRWSATSLHRNYKIADPSEAQMVAWFEAHR
jgi:hypothetical protein